MPEDYAELNLVDQTKTDPGIPRNIPCNRAVLRLGRVEHPDFADVGIKSAKFEPMVSRRHATIKKGNQSWAIIDNKSTNGVMVHNKRIPVESPQVLRDGDIITFGTEQSDLVYTFEINRRRGGCGQQEQVDQEMKKLKALATDGWLNKEEYQNARQAILDKGAPGKWMSWEKTPRKTIDIQGMHERDLQGAKTERALKYEYNFHKRMWQKSVILISMEEKPFDKGAMRECYRMKDYSKPDGENNYVAKIAKDQDEPQHTYFLDIEMHALCQYFAREFNAMNPPKRVEFVDAGLIECIERPFSPLFAIEPFMKGKYIKHNNNWGFVSPDDRNTPQAFSHFTYTHSSGFYIVVDVQGVGDCYTDPQVHSKDAQGFGKGNMGLKGINRFFATHECNSVCCHLGIDTNRKKKEKDLGTRAVPARGNAAASPARGRVEGPYHIPESDLTDLTLSREQLDSIIQKFKAYDKGTGFLAKTDLVALCRDLEHKMTSEDVGRVPVNADGRISFPNFLNWWRGL